MGGWLDWPWVFVTPTTTVHAILPGGGFEEAAPILGEDFGGRLARDRWAPYRRFVHALHQTCLGHLLRALDIRARSEAGELEGRALVTAVARLASDFDRLLAGKPSDDQNRRFTKHLNDERDALLTFLPYPGTPATNWPAEQAIRPAVVPPSSRARSAAATEDGMAHAPSR